MTAFLIERGQLKDIFCAAPVLVEKIGEVFCGQGEPLAVRAEA